ncbi:MAG: enoyl-CoA hydratase/isomerase family protein [Candidatus Nanopelagicales bacterium]|nr:enoyl-CoA hydratase/isomerase family protein [Candidatus Nanopelagicales bacterium]MCF8539412.1 enoyl-CoA hydratase/isomerase family protein [Candidatus Nanopelagicales bacterium]MCF8550907.1 enoyl-CoA hydratase/isomerase family protein [Candidatus Nanopelagicales bacterium]
MTNAPSSDHVLYDVADRIATITFNRPEKLNALLPDMIHTYSDLLTYADNDPEVRAIVVTGAGRGFCSGADLSVLGHDPELVQGFLQGQSHATVPGKYLHLNTPVITAINGPAAGLGFVIAMSADIRFAHKDATLSSTFARLGLIAEYGIAWLLPRLIGLGAATDLLISGRTISGSDALALGMVHGASDQPVIDAHQYAADLVTNCSPYSMAVIKSQILRGQNAEFNPSADDAFVEMGHAFGQPDLHAALVGKINKTAPDFPNYQSGQ